MLLCPFANGAEIKAFFFAPQGGDLLCEEHVTGPPPLLLQWVKTEHALVMLFNNGTLQVLRNTQIFLIETLLSKKASWTSMWHPLPLPSSRWTSTQTTQKSSFASRPTTPTCSPTSAASGRHTHTSSACSPTWAAPQSCDTGCATSPSCCSTTPTSKGATLLPWAHWLLDGSLFERGWSRESL